MSTKNKEIIAKQYTANGKRISFASPLVMAIVNVTPDSFYDGGKYSGLADVLSDVRQKIEQGADIIDIGAASSRPNAPLTSAETEWERLRTVLPAIRKEHPDVLISVDTWRAEIAKKCAAEGADLINDISGGVLDADMLPAIAALGLPYILMHMDGTPQTMADNAPYEDVGNTVLAFFRKQIDQLRTLGFTQIILDPGFGFGKSLANNYELLKFIPAFIGEGYPLLAGVSRKSMINKVLGSSPVTSLNGTTVLNTIALLNGASVLRVHDVAEARQAVKLVGYYLNA